MLVITRWYFIDLKTAEVGTCWNCLTWISLKKGYNMGASCKFLKKKTWILYVISIYIYIGIKNQKVYISIINQKLLELFKKHLLSRAPPLCISKSTAWSSFCRSNCHSATHRSLLKVPNQAQNGQTIQDRY